MAIIQPLQYKLWGIAALGTNTEMLVTLPTTVSAFFITLAGDRSLNANSISICGSIPSDNNAIKILRSAYGYVGTDDCSYLVICR